jgi:hypothetical protein
MSGRRAPQGLQADDKLALGLSSAHLGYLLVAGMCAYAVLGMQAPFWLRLPVATLSAGAGAALAWGSHMQRGLDEWTCLWLAYVARPRRSPRDSLGGVSPPHSTGDARVRVSDLPIGIEVAVDRVRMVGTTRSRRAPLPSTRDGPGATR